MPLIPTSVINRSDLFQLSVSAEIHTFPCFSRGVVQAQETLSSAYAKLCMTGLCYLNFTTLYLLEWQNVQNCSWIMTDVPKQN